ncbi:ABC transporter ATP-binding protein [Tardiphaga sp. vice352]|uniref:ABC transporter ATP-binding protein n=1 Tax=unclassified Tardiphaga TaxID=2631404 RepID=UPI0011634CAA|nr:MULTISPECIES: ABC transporter ATP-binding protein [unclassified Tardiphaga]QDM19498.1 ABC transporter ATP-binding protein [Tardiphaga sp. vice278]QDM24474.1 ABC transporter ATP-binding protein [Tardiphaga sp. vice154]QDM29688.1 ABC transporter ATP-binding protein [Tardiphaga sp. vice304]QDM34780.1 ABC transporter ATP-binding protein [Tardiphaga sp. vice352]
MLQVENINVSYGPIEAVSQASIEVKEGEVVAIVGANGAGKTTLLKSIAGLMLPSSGQIVFDNTEITRMEPHRRVEIGIALSPEGRQVFSDQTIRDNLELGAYARRLGKAAMQTAVEEQYELFPRLRERRDQISATLSGGEQQMLAIARALMGAPRLLLLDEPSLGLAPLIIKEIFSIIRGLRARGMTILLVEQMANQALRLADRAYVLDGGRITITGSGSELLAHPEVRRAYLGASH